DLAPALQAVGQRGAKRTGNLGRGDKLPRDGAGGKMLGGEPPAVAIEQLTTLAVVKLVNGVRELEGVDPALVPIREEQGKLLERCRQLRAVCCGRDRACLTLLLFGQSARSHAVCEPKPLRVR